MPSSQLKKSFLSKPARPFLRIADLSRNELDEIFLLATRLKRAPRTLPESRALEGKSVALVFEKPSTRTRLSFEVGVAQLGGSTIMLNREEIGWRSRESVADSARTFSRYVDAVVIRTFEQRLLEEFAEHATVPVINALTDSHHPCQALADMFTIRQHFLNRADIRVCYIGDGNNVCHSLIEICSLFGLRLTVCNPSGYAPKLTGVNPVLVIANNPEDAVRGAHVVYTDVWTSMGQEQSEGQRLKDFSEYAVTQDLMSRAEPNAIFMHCLPANRGLEVEEAVIDGPQSVVFDQAENRLHVQKALLVKLFSS